MQHDAGLVYTIDTSSPFTNGDMYDDQHPNDSGKVKMANLWFKYLKLILPNSDVQAPVITSVPDTIAYLGWPYKYNVDASGVGAPVYSLENPTAGMTINSKTGIISWTPSSIGTNISVSVKAKNSVDSVSQDFMVDVLPAPVLTNNIVSYWKFNETGSPVSYKDLPGINDAYPVNAPYNCTEVSWVMHLILTARIRLDVIDDSSLYFQKTESWTVEMWVKKAASAGERVFLGKFGGSTNYSIGLNSSNQPKFQIQDSSGTSYYCYGYGYKRYYLASCCTVRLIDTNNRLSIYIDGGRTSTH